MRNRILNRLDVPVVEDAISFRGSSCTLMPFWMASALCDSPSTGKHLHPRYSTCESNMPSHQSTFFENREKCPKRAVKIFRSSVSEIKLKIIFKEKKWSVRTKYYTEIKNKGKHYFFCTCANPSITKRSQPWLLINDICTQFWTNSVKL